MYGSVVVAAMDDCDKIDDIGLKREAELRKHIRALELWILELQEQLDSAMEDAQWQRDRRGDR